MIHIQSAVGRIRVTEFLKVFGAIAGKKNKSVPLVNLRHGLVQPDLAWHGSEKILTSMTGL